MNPETPEPTFDHAPASADRPPESEVAPTRPLSKRLLALRLLVLDGHVSPQYVAEAFAKDAAECAELEAEVDRLQAREDALFTVLREARRWAREGGLNWADVEWERHRDALRAAVKAAPRNPVARVKKHSSSTKDGKEATSDERG